MAQMTVAIIWARIPSSWLVWRWWWWWRGHGNGCGGCAHSGVGGEVVHDVMLMLISWTCFMWLCCMRAGWSDLEQAFSLWLKNINCFVHLNSALFQSKLTCWKPARFKVENSSVQSCKIGRLNYHPEFSHSSHEIPPPKHVEKTSVFDIVNSSVRSMRKNELKISPNSHPPISAI
jgi:hypothetical protein